MRRYTLLAVVSLSQRLYSCQGFGVAYAACLHVRVDGIDACKKATGWFPPGELNRSVSALT